MTTNTYFAHADFHTLPLHSPLSAKFAPETKLSATAVLPREQDDNYWTGEVGSGNESQHKIQKVVLDANMMTIYPFTKEGGDIVGRDL